MKHQENNACLIIGISAYSYVRHLPASVLNDADSIHALLGSSQLSLYAEANILRLTDRDATTDAICHALQSLAECSTAESTAFIYFSGHGAQIISGSHAGTYLLPVDARYGSDEELAQTSISSTEFSEALRKICARRVVVIFDCCHSGGIGQPKSAIGGEVKAGLPESYYQQLAQGSGRVIISSSRESEVSWILPDDKNSLFTKHLLNGLSGKAVNVGGLIRIFDLFDYIQPRVTADQPSQHPIFKAELENNFPIALYSGEVTPIAELKTPDDGFIYDVFISYRQDSEDKTWVRKKFVPALKAAGLRVCTDYACFRLGYPFVREMERAVEESRYTLGVFSPDYAESGFTELENVMAQHLGAETRKVRFIGVIYRPCKPSLRFRVSLMVEMDMEDEFDAQIERIALACKQADT